MEDIIMQQISSRIKIRERDQTYKIYTDSPFLKGYIQSSLPTSKENSLIKLNCTPYTIKTLSCTLQELELCSNLLPCTRQTRSTTYTHTKKVIILYSSTTNTQLNESYKTKMFHNQFETNKFKMKLQNSFLFSKNT